MPMANLTKTMSRMLPTKVVEVEAHRSLGPIDILSFPEDGTPELSENLDVFLLHRIIELVLLVKIDTASFSAVAMLVIGLQMQH